jgi:hypothetical protein
MPDYYNTNRLRDRELIAAIAKARSQQEKIFLWFCAHPARLFAPHQIRNILFDDYKTPITSIRRAMTNLEIEGRLVKSNKMTTGEYGRPVHFWKLANQKQMELF